MAAFGERLKKLRKERKLTQTQLAEKLNAGKSTVAMWETCDREPDFEMLKKIADFFNVNTDYLLGRTDNPEPIDTLAFHRSDDPMADLPEKARKSVEDYISYIKEKYKLEDE